jgi:RNA polymerase sigma-70 factor, ECF subfamily
MDEQRAIQRLKAGDIGGLEILVTLYQVRAVRTAFLITRDAAQAEDSVQDAFIQIYRSFRHFDQDRPFAMIAFRQSAKSCWLRASTWIG